MFTAATVLQLVEEGSLSLDEPLLPYLAAITGQPPAGYAGITIEPLLTHTSGLPMSLGLAGTERIHRGPTPWSGGSRTSSGGGRGRHD